MNQDKLMLVGITTITANHCGTGQASGAIDLPIARETHTGLPVLPASTIKGVMRDGYGLPDTIEGQTESHEEKVNLVKDLFGPRPPKRANKNEDGDEQREEKQERDSLSAGNLVFLDGMLLAFPVRSLRGVFRWVTSPMLINRLRRVIKAFDPNWSSVALKCPSPSSSNIVLVGTGRGTQTVSLEDMVFPPARCNEAPAVDDLADSLAGFMSEGDKDGVAKSLKEKLVVVTDEVLTDLTLRGTTVNARIVLDRDNKTSDNLWYEETLPPDTVFATVIAPRPGARDGKLKRLRESLGKLRGATADSSASSRTWYTQLGGNVTVGQGLVQLVFDVPVDDELSTEGGK